MSPALNRNFLSGFVTNTCDILMSDDVLSVIMAYSFSLSDEKHMLFCPLRTYIHLFTNDLHIFLFDTLMKITKCMQVMKIREVLQYYGILLSFTSESNMKETKNHTELGERMGVIFKINKFSEGLKSALDAANRFITQKDTFPQEEKNNNNDKEFSGRWIDKCTC